MEDMITNLGGQVLYALLVFAAGYLWKAVRQNQREERLVRDGLCALLRDKLLQRCEECLAGGYCTPELREDLEKMFHDYSSLGGNGVIPPIYNRVIGLPIQDRRNG